MSVYNGSKSAPAQLPERETSLDDLKKLAGIGEGDPGKAMTARATDIAKYQREHGIRPGTDEWFRLWFAKPTLTGEKPYDK